MDEELKESWKYFFKIANRMRNFVARNSGKNSGRIDKLSGKLDRLTGAQERVLGSVFSHCPKGAMVKDIAGELGLTPGAVSQTVESLVREGMLERRTSETDRRAVTVHPSEMCRRFRDANLGHFNNIMEKALSSVSQQERLAFLKVLKIVEQSFTEKVTLSEMEYVGEVIDSEEHA